MKIRNYPRTQLWIDLNTYIVKWMYQGEKIILMGDWNSEALEVKKWMGTQGLANTICDLHGYSYAPITYQQLKDCPIDGIDCTSPLMSNLVGLISFGRLLVYHRSLWIELHESILLLFQQNAIIPPMAWNLNIEDPRKIKKFNDTPDTNFFKHDIYQKVPCLNNRDIYPLPTHIARVFEILDELITRLMHEGDKNTDGK